MSKNRSDELSTSAIHECSVGDTDGLAIRSLSGSFTRSRKNSRIATVKPVTKCLSSSEEDLTKADKLAHRGSASPRIAKLLSKDMTSMDKDVIVAELEKCLSELEKDDNPYSTLGDEYKRMEEERDGLAKELENAFGDLEDYMHHVHDIEAALKSSEAERDELAKEVEYLKYCLTHRKEVENSSLKLGKETLEAQLKEVKEENEKMKEQVDELLTERESLIQSLLNLHSSEVDDVIQSRSRSCSVVSIESTSSSLLRSECAELKDRAEEAEESELKMANELQKCKEYLEEALRDKVELENCIKNMRVEISEMEEDEMNFKERIDELNKERREELRAKDKEINQVKKEIDEMKKEHEKSNVANKKTLRQNESKDRATAELLKSLEDEKSLLSKELRMVKDEFEKYKDNMNEDRKEYDELKSKSQQVSEILRAKSLEFEQMQQNFDGERKKWEEIESNCKKARREKTTTEKQMAELKDVIVKEREKSNMDKMDLDNTISNLNAELDKERKKIKKLEEQKSSASELNEKIRNLTSENEHLSKEVRKLRLEVRQLKEELVVEKGIVRENESNFIQKEKELSEAKERVARFESEFEHTSRLQDQLKNENRRIEREMGDLKGRNENEIELLANENMSLKERVECLQHEVGNLESMKEDLVKLKERLSTEKTLREKIELEKRELEERLEDERSRSTKEREEWNLELTKAVKNTNDLQEKVNREFNDGERLKKFESTIRNLKQSLSEANNTKLDIESRFVSQMKEVNLAHDDEKTKLKEEGLRSRMELEDKCERQIGHLKSKVEDLNIFIERAETKVREQELELRNVKEQLVESEAHVASLRKEKSVMQLEVGKLRTETVTVKSELDRVTRQLRNACADVEKAVGEKKLIKEQLERSNFELENLNTMRRSSTEPGENFLAERYEKLSLELQTEINRLKEEQREIEVDLQTTKSHLEQAQDKELKYRHSVDGLSENIERLRKEKSQLEKDLELRDKENSELSEKVRLLTQKSGTSDSDRVMAENTELQKRCSSLQDELSKAYGSNKTLTEKLRKSDEANASMMRSLKARKTELQIQLVNVQHEKEDLVKEVRLLKEEVASLREKSNSNGTRVQDENETVQNLEKQVRALKNCVEGAEVKIKSLEEGAEQYKEKLHESEELILDLQKAVARANDVAMEKALESSRQKRLFEKKFEKILKENFALQKRIYFDGSNSHEIDRNGHGRSLSELASPTRDKRAENDRNDSKLDDVNSKINCQPPRKQSSGELHKVIARGMDGERNSLWRSSSAASAKKDGFDARPIRTKITAGSVTPPVRYTSDTDSIGSKPDSNDGDNAPSSPTGQKSLQSLYQDYSKEALQREDERQTAISQPNRIHRPILLKEIKLPNLSPAEERKSQVMYSPGSRSPVMRSPAMRRKQEKRSPAVDRDTNVKERMEHWV